VAIRLIENLAMFHDRFSMAMGDIKPSNIVYHSFTDTVHYIDLEYSTTPPRRPRITKSNGLLSISIPDPCTRYYRAVTTIAYSSFEKRCGGDYCVFENDRYALATTLFCMLTNDNPPGTLVDDHYLSPSTDKSNWYDLHAESFYTLVTNSHSVLNWDNPSTGVVLNFIQRYWELSGAPLFTT
jgi:serine/threonine protein kinase